MNRIFLGLLFCLGFGASALADGRIFPPDGCSSASPFMAFNATPDSNTYCTNGQSVLSNALQGCGADQVVAFNGSAFYCKELSQEQTETQNLTVPECAPGEVLTGAAGALACVSSSSSGLTAPIKICAVSYANAGVPLYDALPVPQSWTISVCKQRADSEVGGGGADYKVGCLTSNGIKWGGVGSGIGPGAPLATPPSPNCGW